jgi:hypothetical protein
MDPILIVAYPDKIAAEQTWLDNQISYLQGLYNQFTAISITPTLQDLTTLRYSIINGPTFTNSLEDYVVSKMLEKTGTPTFNGIPIKPEKVRDMINIPNSEPIRNWILNIGILRLVNGLYDKLQPELFEIVSGVVQRKSTTNDLITAKYSYYTKNDKGVQTYNLLQEWNTAVNAFNVRLANVHATFQVPHFSMISTPGGLRPSVEVIRANEDKYPADYITE